MKKKAHYLEKKNVSSWSSVGSTSTENDIQ